MFKARFLQVLLAAAGEGDAGGGGESTSNDASDAGDVGVPEKVFSVEDMNRIVQQRLSKEARKYQGLADAAAKYESQKSELEELRAKLEDAGANESQKVLNQMKRELLSAQNQLKSLQEERDAAFQERDKASVGLKSYVVANTTTSALAEAGALPTSMRHAVAMMQIDTKPELITKDDGSQVVQYDIDGVLVTTPQEAAKRWLAANPHFAKARGGSGGVGNGARGGLTTEQMDDMSPEDLLRLGMS